MRYRLLLLCLLAMPVLAAAQTPKPVPYGATRTGDINYTPGLTRWPAYATNDPAKVFGIDINGNLVLRTIAAGSDGNNYPTTLAFNSGTRLLTLGRNGLPSISVAIPVEPSVTPTLDEVLMSGNSSEEEILISDGSNSAHIFPGNFQAFEANGWQGFLSADGLALKTNALGSQALLKSDYLTAVRLFQFPDLTGTLALRSQIADSLDISGYVSAGSNITLSGSGTKASPLIINASGGSISGLTAGYLPQATSTTTIGNSGIYFAGNGNIGVGTTTPNFGIHFVKNGLTGIQFQHSVGDYNYFFYAGANTYGAGFYDGILGADVFTMYAGKIGILNVNPQTTLDVAGSATVRGYLDLTDVGIAPGAPSSGCRIYSLSGHTYIICAGESSATLIH